MSEGRRNRSKDDWRVADWRSRPAERCESKPGQLLCGRLIAQLPPYRVHPDEIGPASWGAVGGRYVNARRVVSRPGWMGGRSTALPLVVSERLVSERDETQELSTASRAHYVQLMFKSGGLP